MRYIFSSMLAASAALAAAPAALATDGEFFVQGALGQSHFNFDSSIFEDVTSNSYEIAGGYRWHLAPNFALGAEAALTDLGMASDRHTHVNGGNVTLWTRRQKAKSLLLGANLKWNVANRFYLTARGGWATTHTGYRDVTPSSPYDGTAGTYVVYSSASTFSSWYAGAGAGYDLTPSFGLALRYDVFGLNRLNRIRWNETVSRTSLVAEYRF